MHRLMLTLITTFIAAAGMLIPAVASAGSPGWIVRCPYNGKTLKDDPILLPGKPGGFWHFHDFFGAKTTTANSTYLSMQAGGTTCGLPQDTAGYWVPALYRNGVPIRATGNRQKFYYRENTGTPVQAFPAGFKMIAGNAHAKSESDNPKLGSAIYWGCSDNSSPGKLKAPRSCSTGIISLHVGFPSCWDGSPASPANVVYPSGGCPSSHPKKLPRLIMRFEYPVGTDLGTITLDSGPPYTAHGDFWNTWNQPKLESLVQDCLNANKNCGQF